MPAATAPRTPLTLSSITRQRAGAHPISARGMQEQIGRRLAARNLLGAEHVRREARVEAREAEAVAQPRERAAGRHATGGRQPVERLVNARDHLQVALEGGVDLHLHGGGEALRQGAAVLDLEGAVHRLRRHAEKARQDLGLGERDADASELCGLDARADQLAVDQHAVAVEDHQIGIAHARPMDCDARLRRTPQHTSLRARAQGNDNLSIAAGAKRRAATDRPHPPARGPGRRRLAGGHHRLARGLAPEPRCRRHTPRQFGAAQRGTAGRRRRCARSARSNGATMRAAFALASSSPLRPSPPISIAGSSTGATRPKAIRWY